MTHRFFPKSFDAFPHPWNIVDWDDRNDFVEQLPIDYSHRADALFVLKQCLAFAITQYADTGRFDTIPVQNSEQTESEEELFFDSTVFFDSRFKELMPTIADITWERIKQGLTSDEPFTYPSSADSPVDLDAFIKETGEQRAFVITDDLIDHLVRWLRNAVKDPVATSDKRIFLDLLKTDIPRLSGRRGSLLVGTIWALAEREEARAYFVELENNSDTPQETREQAEHFREVIEFESSGDFPSVDASSIDDGSLIDLGTVKVSINPVAQADLVYHSADNVIHLDEVEASAEALVDKFQKDQSHLDKMFFWRERKPRRQIRIWIHNDEGWAELFGLIERRGHELIIGGHVLNRLIDYEIPVTIGSKEFSPAQLEAIRHAVFQARFAPQYRLEGEASLASIVPADDLAKPFDLSISGEFLPESLNSLNHPWNISSRDDRRRAIAQLPLDQEHRMSALSALQHCLTYSATKHAEAVKKLNAPLSDSFYERLVWNEPQFTQRMPTLAEITRESLYQAIVDTENPLVLFGPNSRPSNIESLIEKIGQSWATGVVADLISHLLRWLTKAVAEPAAAQDKTTLIEILKSAVPSLDWRDALRLMGTIWTLAEPEERAYYFFHLAHNENVPTETRTQAQRFQNMILS